MAGTSVKGVSTLLPAFAAQQGMAKTGGIQTGTDNFQSVLNRQTEQTRQPSDHVAADKRDALANEEKTPDTVEKAGQPEKAEIPEEAEAPEKVKEVGETKASEKPRKEMAQTDAPEDAEGVDEEAMEVLQSAAIQLVEQLAETFGISTEEVQELMNRLRLSSLDLLQADKLGTLVLEAGGAGDSLSLLTDETLYQNFQSLMKGRENLVQEVAQQLGREIGELEAQLQAKDFAADSEAFVTEESLMEETASEEPAIEIVVERLPMDEQETDVSGEAKALLQEEEPVRENVAKTPFEEKASGTTTADGAKESVTERVSFRTGDSGRQKQGQFHSGGQQQTGNLVLQQIRTELTTPQSQQVVQSSFAGEVDTQNIMRQIMDYMKIQIKPDTTNLEMQLHPASLGTLQVQVASRGGVMTAQFITQNEAVKAVLENQMVQLKESFEQQGIKVDAIEVHVQTQQFDRNLNQGGNGQPEAQERKSRTRRIRLEGDFKLPETQDWDEEEQLAADIMAANGNTVDYTA
ncbi:MAG: flagellar hook-length control protein FliK [Roseburia sp.]|nr:flagellar hook-length control protein FliK [Roseburia sp.]